jgi:hypothetical protein
MRRSGANYRGILIGIVHAIERDHTIRVGGDLA